MATAKKPTPADIAKRKAIAKKTVTSPDPAMKKMPSYRSATTGKPAAKSTSYFGNIAKEIGDRSRASDRASKANYEARYGIMGIKQPGAQARASKASKTLGRATGQLLGAVLQGRRYDAQGRIIQAPKKQVGKITPLKATKKVKKK